MVDEIGKIVSLVLCLLLITVFTVGMAEGASVGQSVQAPAGLSREVIANFTGVMRAAQSNQPHVPISREVIANFAGVMRAAQSSQPHVPISREVITNFAGVMKAAQSSQKPVGKK